VRDRFLFSEITGRGYRYPKVPASPGKSFRLGRSYEIKESKQDRDLSSAIQGNLCGEEAGVSRGHSRRRKLSWAPWQLETSPDKQGWTHPAEGPNTKKGETHP